MASPTDREAAPDVAAHDALASEAAAERSAAPDSEEQTAPHTSSGAALDSLHAQPAPATSQPCPGKGLQRVFIGYEPGIPLQGGKVETRAMRVLEDAFPARCFEKTLTSMRREDLAPSIVKGKIDVGIVAMPSASEFTDKDVTLLPAAGAEGVDVVMLQPASYAVVAAKPETMASLAIDYPNVWLFPPLGLVAGVVSLIFITYLLNFRVARGPDITPAHTRIDPRLARLGSAVHWMYSATSGRLLSAIWGALGAALTLGLVSSQDLVEAATPRAWNARDGAARAAYPGRDIYELRNDQWKKCSQPYKCLQNYENKVTPALAGDRDVLCRYEAESHSTRLQFVDDVAIPILYALLVPPANPDAPAGAIPIGDQMLAALRKDPYAGSPFSACPASAAERQ